MITLANQRYWNAYGLKDFLGELLMSSLMFQKRRGQDQFCKIHFIYNYDLKLYQLKPSENYVMQLQTVAVHLN